MEMVWLHDCHMALGASCMTPLQESGYGMIEANTSLFGALARLAYKVSKRNMGFGPPKKAKKMRVPKF